MKEPKVAQKSPYVVELDAGKYYWCSCGHSSNQPYCDGSHKGTDFVPTVTEIEEKKTVAFCGCKHAKNGPFCDGTHSSI